MAGPPKLKLKEKEISVFDGDPLEIKVDLSGGIPQPEVDWQKDGAPVGKWVTKQQHSEFSDTAHKK